MWCGVGGHKEAIADPMQMSVYKILQVLMLYVCTQINGVLMVSE